MINPATHPRTGGLHCRGVILAQTGGQPSPSVWHFIAQEEVYTTLYSSPNVFCCRGEAASRASCPIISDVQRFLVMHGGRLGVPRLYLSPRSNLGRIKPSFLRAESPFPKDQFKNDGSQLCLQLASSSSLTLPGVTLRKPTTRHEILKHETPEAGPYFLTGQLLKAKMILASFSYSLSP